MKTQMKRTTFNFREVNESFREFMKANRHLKKESFNAQLGKAVEAGAMSYPDMLLYRDKYVK